MTKKLDDEDELDLLSDLLLEDDDTNLDTLDEDEEELAKLQAEMDAELEFVNEKNNIVYSKQKTQSHEKDLKPNKSVLMSFKEYEAKFGPMTKGYEHATKEYKTASFPELHEDVKHNDDVESKTSLLALSRPAKILSSLIQMEVEKNKNKKKNLN